MELNNTYTISYKNINLLLDDINTIISDLEKFKSKHDGYSYNIVIFKNPNRKKRNLWSAEIEIRNEKQKSKESLKGAIEPPTLL